jgi:hypothetical protein
MFRLLTTHVFQSIIIVFGFLLYYYFLVYVFIYLLALYLCIFLTPKICGFGEAAYDREVGTRSMVYRFTDKLDARYECVYLSDKFEGFDASQLTDEGLLENRELAHKYLVGNLHRFPTYWGSTPHMFLFSSWVRATIQLLAHTKKVILSHYMVCAVALIFLVFVYLSNML